MPGTTVQQLMLPLLWQLKVVLAGHPKQVLLCHVPRIQPQHLLSDACATTGIPQRHLPFSAVTGSWTVQHPAKQWQLQQVVSNIIIGEHQGLLLLLLVVVVVVVLDITTRQPVRRTQRGTDAPD
jgi:hypothetical protein